MAGGGIGEAALISAVIGGGVSAVKGEDPLKGALMGALMGGASGGISSLLSPAASTVAGSALAPAVAESALASSLVNPVVESTLASGLTNTALPALNPEFADAALRVQDIVSNAGPGTQLAGDLTPEILDYYNKNTITQAQDQLITNHPNYNPDIASQNQQHLLSTAKFHPEHEQLVNAASQIPRGYPTNSSGLSGLMDKLGNLPMQEKLLYGGTAALAAPAIMSMFKSKEEGGKEEYDGPLKKFKYDPSRYTPLEVTPPTPYQPVYKDYRNYAGGGIANLGKYSDYASGGRMLKGPGDGMSDDIPATIAGKQPARLANEEFVIPADVVSHLGNGSSEAGAKQLYKMMDRVRHARTGKKKQGKQITPEKYLA